MLVTSTLVFVALAVRSAADAVLLVVSAMRRSASLPAQRAAARRRLTFLVWYAIALAAIYGVYLASLHR
jgi:hypothetical protein